ATTIGVAMTGRAGVDTIGHIPGAERSRVAFGQGTSVLVLALLERLLRLLGGLFTADGQSTRRPAVATAAAIFTHVIEAAQFAAFVGSVVAIDVGAAAAATADMHGGLGGLALADHRQQGQGRWRAFLELEFLAQRFDLGVGQLLGVTAQQGLR